MQKYDRLPLGTSSGWEPKIWVCSLLFTILFTSFGFCHLICFFFICFLWQSILVLIWIFLQFLSFNLLLFHMFLLWQSILVLIWIFLQFAGWSWLLLTISTLHLTRLLGNKGANRNKLSNSDVEVDFVVCAFCTSFVYHKITSWY